jgi:hypothetical protein
MRGDEHGCADLRRSLTARTKPVRSLTYDPPITPGPDACTAEVGGCARGVSVALVAGSHPGQRARRPRRYSRPVVIRHRTGSGSGSGDRTPHGPRAGGPWPEPPCRGSDGRAPSCRDVKSRHSHSARTSRDPRPLDAIASRELCGIGGKCERTARGPRNRSVRNSRRIGALTYDTYARAAPSLSRGLTTPCEPGRTRA